MTFGLTFVLGGELPEEAMNDNLTEIPEINAAKRLGIWRCPWMGDWFTSWSPRNDNNNAEGTWHQWANMAAMILSHPATKEVAPHLFRPDLKPEHLYADGVVLTDEQIEKLFRKE